MAGFEASDRALALLLRYVAVQGGSAETSRFQPVGKIGRFELGPYENQHRLEAFRFQQARERVQFVQAADEPVALADLRSRAGTILNRDLRGIAHVFGRDAPDRRGHGRREQRNLPLLRRLLEDPLDVIDESHLQHFIALVQNDEAQGLQVERAAVHVIHHPAGSADDHMRAAFESLELRDVALPAINRQNVETLQVGRVALECLGDLDGQLARGHQDQRLRGALAQIDPVQHRQRKGGCFSGAGLRLPEDIGAGQQQRNGLSLNGRRRLVAHGGEALENEFAQAQLAKAGRQWCVGGGQGGGAQKGSGLYRNIPAHTPLEVSWPSPCTASGIATR